MPQPRGVGVGVVAGRDWRECAPNMAGSLLGGLNRLLATKQENGISNNPPPSPPPKILVRTAQESTSGRWGHSVGGFEF